MPQSHTLLASCATVVMLAVGAALLPIATAGAAGQFDGSYQGKQTQTQGNNSGPCAHLDRGNVRIVVQNNHFDRTWGEARLSVDVAPDGTFSQSAMVQDKGRMRSAAIKGRISGNALEADVGTDLCAVHMSLTKS